MCQSGILSILPIQPPRSLCLFPKAFSYSLLLRRGMYPSSDCRRMFDFASASNRGRFPRSTIPLYMSTFTRQTASSPSSSHCPSPGRTGGLSKGSRASWGRPRCTGPRGVVSVRQSTFSAKVSCVHSLLHAWAQRSRRTCWLMSTIAISFLCLVNWSKASSMAAVSVLPSTTR